MDDLSLSAKGLVVLPRHGEPQVAQTAVAGLLEALLAAVTDEVQPVPPALRSLPARLREASTDTTPAVRDLLSILRWHLRHDPRQVAARTRRTHGIARVEPTRCGNANIRLRRRSNAAAAGSRRSILASSTGGRIHASDTATPAPARVLRHSLRAALVAIRSVGLCGLSLPAVHPDLVRAAQPIVSTSASRRHPRASANRRDRTSAAAHETSPRPLPLPVRGGAFSPSFAAQPRTLLFHAGHNTTGQLYTATLDDRGVPVRRSRRCSTSPPATITRACRRMDSGSHLTPTATASAAYTSPTGRATSISRVSGDGFGAVPSWSPDMKSLAFVRAEPGRPRVWNLWIRTSSTGDAVARHRLPIRPGLGRVVVS